MAIVPDGSGNNPGNPNLNNWDGTDDHIPSQRELQRLFWASQIGSVDVDIVLTTPYTVVPDDRLKVKLFNNASAVEVHLPADAPINFSFVAYQLGTGQVYAVIDGAGTNAHPNSHNAVSGQYGQVKWTVIGNVDGHSAIWEPTGDTALHGPDPGDVTSPTFINANTFNVAENAQLAFTLQADEPVFFSITGGVDAGDYEIYQPVAPSMTATLRWVGNNTKNYELPDDSDTNNTYVVQVTATDASSNASNQTITGTVTDVAEGGGDTTPPTFISSSSGTVAENETLSHTIEVNEVSTITIVGGVDASRFEIVQAVPATTAVLRWTGNGTKDFETPNDSNIDNSYVVQVRATDAAGNFTNQTITYTVLNVSEGGGSGHHPSPVDPTWVEAYYRDYKVKSVVSLNAGQSDNGIIADPGELKPAGFRYREGGQSGGTYNEIGIPGWGYDVFVDPTATSLLPTEYLKARPLGEFEPIPGVGIRIYTRESTGPAMNALIASQFGDVNGASGKGVAVHLSGLLASYWKIEAEPPFARAVWFVPESDYADKAFLAANWSYEASNRAYPNDTVEVALEMDDQEFLGFGTGGLGTSMTFHGYGGGYNGPIGSGVYNHGDGSSPKGKEIGILTRWDTDRIRGWGQVNGGAWELIGELTLANMAGANYQQPHIIFTHNISWGFPWLAAIDNPTKPSMHFDLVRTGFWHPASNTTVVAPSTEPPDEVVLTWTAPNPIPEDTTGKIADLTVPADVSTISIKTAYPNRFQIIGSGTARELHVVGAGLNYSDQPVLRFALEGVKASGHKSTGRIYSRNISDVVGYPAAWWNPNAIIEVDYDNNRAYIAGTGEVAVTAVHNSGGGLTAAARAAMNVSAYVMIQESDGAGAAPYGFFGNNSDYFLGQYQFHLTPPRISLNVGGSGDQFADVAGYGASKADPMIAAFTTGVGGSKIAASMNNAAGAAIASTANRPTQAFTGGNFWDTGYGDRDYVGNKHRLLIIAPQHVGGTTGNVLSNGQLQSIVQNGV